MSTAARIDTTKDQDATTLLAHVKRGLPLKGCQPVEPQKLGVKKS